MISRAIDLTIGLAGTILTAPLVAMLALAIRLGVPWRPVYRQKRDRPGRPPVSRSTSCARWSAAPSTRAPGWRSPRATTRITRIGALLRRYSLDELPNLWNVVRGEMAIVGPRPTLEGQVLQYTERQRGRLAVRPGITGWAQVNGRASLPWPERIELDLWYVEHRSLALDLQILGRTFETVVGGHGIYKGVDGRLGRLPERDPVTRDVTCLLTGVGKRYDIVSAFAQHATDGRRRSQPARPGAVRGRRAPLGAAIHDPDYVPALQALCQEFGVGAVVPLTDLDLEMLGHARVAGRLPAFVPDPAFARATFDKYETHLLLERLGLPSPPTVLPGEPVHGYPVMIKPRQGSGARSIHRADDEREASSSSTTSVSRR